MFGERDELLAEARDRIAADPDRYIDHIFGEHEGGGTSVLYLSGVPFEQLGFPTLGSEPMGHASERMVHLTPAVAGTAIVGLAALSWLTEPKEPGQEA